MKTVTFQPRTMPTHNLVKTNYILKQKQTKKVLKMLNFFFKKRDLLEDIFKICSINEFRTSIFSEKFFEILAVIIQFNNYSTNLNYMIFIYIPFTFIEYCWCFFDISLKLHNSPIESLSSRTFLPIHWKGRFITFKHRLEKYNT